MRLRNAFTFFAVVCLVLLFGVLLAGAASAQTCSATLSWEAPTQNTDGSPLTDLAGFKVYWGTSSGNYTQSSTINDPSQTATVVEGLSAAQWFFAVTSFNAGGLESSYSNQASKTTFGCVALPDPRPPAGVALAVSVEVAFQYLAQTDRAVLLPVGAIPEDTVCNPAEMIVAGGEVYYGVPRAAVTWYGTVEPAAVYARCD